MLKDADFKVVYSSGEDEPVEFYIDSLMESTSFDLGLGFFSSSGFRALSLGFAYFINKGGKMRIIINNILSPEDKLAILNGYNLKPEELIEKKISEDLLNLYTLLSSYDKHFFNCISWLIASNRIEFKAIIPIDNNLGIAHQKFGIFVDNAKNLVAFSGSANFSNNALFNNIETLSCYKSWTGENSESERVSYFVNLFDKLWHGRSEKVRIIPLENIKTIIQDKFPVNSLNELLQEEMELIIDQKKSSNISPELNYKLAEIENQIRGENNEPKFPHGNTPRPYQMQAKDFWLLSNCNGFFEMATGTGKTITSLNCALHLYQEEGRLRMLILVPSLSLADQWAEETSAFNFKNIIIANSKNQRWAQEIISEINKSLLMDNSFVIITTYATFAMDRFQAVIAKLDSDVLFIADEAHNFGTERLIELYPNKFKRRIGLSATPKRHFDEQGTKSILSFFNAIKEPTYRLNMEEAIEAGFLCEYYYFPKIVSLTSNELEEYKIISLKLLRYFNQATGRFADNPIVNILLQKRKSIIHKAELKKNCLRECLIDIKKTKEEIKYTLVYVPEGIESNEIIDDFDKRLIDEYSAIISNEFHLTQHQFIGETDNRGDVISRFAQGRLQVLTAMKCLDEGVDVKRTETAIFCSSTGNPRQFIQRRGRILRLHDDKKYATIYDMVVVPDLSQLNEDDNLSMEKSILKAELKRVYEFASLSRNKYQSLKTLEDIAEQFNIDIFSTEIS